MRPDEVAFCCGAGSLLLVAGLVLGRVSGAMKRRDVGRWQLSLKELIFVTMLAAFCIRYLAEVPWVIGLERIRQLL